MKRPHSGIIRIVSGRAADQAAMVSAALARYEDEFLAGSVMTVESARVRIRSAKEQDS